MLTTRYMFISLTIFLLIEERSEDLDWSRTNTYIEKREVYISENTDIRRIEFRTDPDRICVKAP